MSAINAVTGAHLLLICSRVCVAPSPRACAQVAIGSAERCGGALAARHAHLEDASSPGGRGELARARQQKKKALREYGYRKMVYDRAVGGPDSDSEYDPDAAVGDDGGGGGGGDGDGDGDAMFRPE